MHACACLSGHVCASVCMLVGSLSFHVEIINDMDVGIESLSASQLQQNTDLTVRFSL